MKGARGSVWDCDLSEKSNCLASRHIIPNGTLHFHPHSSLRLPVDGKAGETAGELRGISKPSFPFIGAYKAQG